MAGVALDRSQEELKSSIEESLKKLKSWASGQYDELSNEDRQQIISDMAIKAHELHMSITPRPKHKRHMIENRGYKPEDISFYKHIHPVEDLLEYIVDTTVNDDPTDQTIGLEFQLKVYSRRWRHIDAYRVTRTDTGWSVMFMGEAQICRKDGTPGVFDLLTHDSINYPAKLSKYFEGLWNDACENGLSSEKIQSILDQIGEWISACEKYTPKVDY